MEWPKLLYSYITMSEMFIVLDFFESDDQDSDLGPPQNVLQLESQQKWEVNLYSMCIKSRYLTLL